MLQQGSQERGSLKVELLVQEDRGVLGIQVGRTVNRSIKNVASSLEGGSLAFDHPECDGIIGLMVLDR